MPYRVSAGFLNNDGTLKTTNMTRGTVGLNLTPTLLDNRLTINLNGKGVFTHNSFADEGAIGAAVKYNPLKPVYNEDGSYHYWMQNGAPNTMATLNPVAQLEQQLLAMHAQNPMVQVTVGQKNHVSQSERTKTEFNNPMTIDKAQDVVAQGGTKHVA